MSCGHCSDPDRDDGDGAAGRDDWKVASGSEVICVNRFTREVKMNLFLGAAFFGQSLFCINGMESRV